MNAAIYLLAVVGAFTVLTFAVIGVLAVANLWPRPSRSHKVIPFQRRA